MRRHSLRVKQMARELAWVLAGQAVALLIGIMLTKVLTSSLGPEQYGQLALALTIPLLLNQALFGPLTVAVMRFFSAYTELGLIPRMLGVVGIAMRRGISAIVGVGLVAAIAAGAFSGDATWTPLVAVAVVFGVLYSVFSLYNTMQVAARDRVNAAVHQAADPAVRLVAASFSLAIFGATAVSAMVGFAAGAGLVLLSQWSSFRRATRGAQSSYGSPEVGIAKQLWNYGKFYLAFGTFTWALLSSDRWALRTFGDDVGVGTYAAAFQIASLPATVAAGAFAQFVIPIVFQRAGDASDATRRALALTAIRWATAGMAVLIGIATGIAIVAGEPLIVLFTSSAYRQSAVYLPFLVLGLGLMQVGHMISLVPTSFNRMGAYSAIKIGHSVGAVGVNAAAARWFGVTGVCEAQVAIGAAFVALVLWNNVRMLKIDAPIRLRE